MSEIPETNHRMFEDGVSAMLRAQKLEIPRPYTEGVCEDGAAILKDGQMMTISEVLDELNEFAWIKHCAAVATKRKRVSPRSPHPGMEG